MKNITLFLCLIICLPLTQLTAQKANKKVYISGTVLDVEDKPMVNAIIMIDGANTSVLTNAEGKYRIKVKPYARTIGVVAFGSGVKEEAIAERTEINFYFKTKSVESEVTANKEEAAGEAVNTGYNKVEKKNLTTSISKVDGGKPKRSYSTIYEMLQTVPGVKVTGRSVVVQDSRNLQGAVEPLFVVDGVPVSSIDDIIPATVESIEVLKGTAAAIYGTRAFGGAILIKRKAL